MKLSKTIPARKKTVRTVRFKWAYKNCMECNEAYLKLRNGLHGRRKGTMTSCDWCHHKFEVGEWFGIGRPEPNQEGPKRNWALCNKCAERMGAEDAPSLKKF